jgi:hypothetical protein
VAPQSLSRTPPTGHRRVASTLCALDSTMCRRRAGSRAPRRPSIVRSGRNVLKENGAAGECLVVHASAAGAVSVTPIPA